MREWANKQGARLVLMTSSTGSTLSVYAPSQELPFTKEYDYWQVHLANFEAEWLAELMGMEELVTASGYGAVPSEGRN